MGRLRYSTPPAAVTPTHASYPRHSSSAVVFGAAQTCRNIRAPVVRPSGAWRKGRVTNLVTSRTRVSPNPHETAARQRVSVEADLATTRQTVTDSPASCVLGSVPAGISVPPQGGGTPSARSHKATPLGRQKPVRSTRTPERHT